MSLLTERFNKVNKTLGRKDNLLIEKEVIENTYKDNEVLQKYIKIIKELDKIQQDEKLNKDALYDLMMEEDIDHLEGSNCQVTLKKPYTKKEFDLKGFTDVHTKNKYYLEIYEKFVKDKVVKGNVNIKILKD